MTIRGAHAAILCLILSGCGGSYPEYPTDVRKAYTEAAAAVKRDQANRFVLHESDYKALKGVKKLLGERWSEISCSNGKFFDVQIKYSPELFFWKKIRDNHHGTSNKLRHLGWEASNCLTYEILTKKSKEHMDEVSVFLVKVDGKWKILDE